MLHYSVQTVSPRLTPRPVSAQSNVIRDVSNTPFSSVLDLSLRFLYLRCFQGLWIKSLTIITWIELQYCEVSWQTPPAILLRKALLARLLTAENTAGSEKLSGSPVSARRCEAGRDWSKAVVWRMWKFWRAKWLTAGLWWPICLNLFSHLHLHLPSAAPEPCQSCICSQLMLSHSV